MKRNISTNRVLAPVDDKVLQILAENHHRFRKFLAKRIGNAIEAEEILQQSFSKGVENPPNTSNQESVLAWFFKILRNTLIDHYRSKTSETKKNEELRREAMVEAQLTEAHTEVCQCLKGLLPTLKDEYAQVLNLVDLEEKTPEEVAAQLGISRNNLDVRLHRARKALKETLVRACGTCTEHGCLDCTCR